MLSCREECDTETPRMAVEDSHGDGQGCPQDGWILDRLSYPMLCVSSHARVSSMLIPPVKICEDYRVEAEACVQPPLPPLFCFSRALCSPCDLIHHCLVQAGQSAVSILLRPVLSHRPTTHPSYPTSLPPDSSSSSSPSSPLSPPRSTSSHCPDSPSDSRQHQPQHHSR